MLRKRARLYLRELYYLSLRVAAPLRGAVMPYRFSADRYPGSFLARPCGGDLRSGPLPRRVFVLWTGSNPLTPNRARNLEMMREQLGVPVVLVTPDTVQEWILPEHPLHPAYDHLSLVHRSDYLRAYLLHHHGGGYADIKRPTSDWRAVFDRMDADLGAWICSYGEVGPGAVALLEGRLGKDLLGNWHQVVGCGAIIARPGSPFTSTWLGEVESRLDAHTADLQVAPGGVRGDEPGYPLRWTEIMGDVYQPLQLEYLQHVRRDDELLPSFRDYL